MKDTILIIGINGSLGKEIKKYYESKNNFQVFGTTSNIKNVTKNIFLLDFLNIETIKNFKNLNINHLIITSGYEPKYNLKNINLKHLNKMFNIHVIGPMMLIQKMQNMFKKNSTITFLSSPAALQGSYDPSYSAVKGATNSLVRTLAKDLAPNIRVNALSPSLIKDSTVYKSMTNDFKNKHLNNTLNKKLLLANECVNAIDFILKNNHYTGQILHLNGGMIYG